QENSVSQRPQKHSLAPEKPQSWAAVSHGQQKAWASRRSQPYRRPRLINRAAWSGELRPELRPCIRGGVLHDLLLAAAALGVAALVLVLAFALTAFGGSQSLPPLNRPGLALGRLLHKSVRPLVMSVIFFAAVTPTRWIKQMRRKDPLSLKRRPG